MSGDECNGPLRIFVDMDDVEGAAADCCAGIVRRQGQSDVAAEVDALGQGCFVERLSLRP